MSEVITAEDLYGILNAKGLGMVQVSKSTYHLVKGGMHIRPSVENFFKSKKSFHICCKDPNTLTIHERESGSGDPQNGMLYQSYVVATINKPEELLQVIS